MTEVADLKSVSPSATPEDQDVLAWKRLSRDEQVRRTRLVLQSEEASAPVATSMTELWEEVAREVGRGG